MMTKTGATQKITNRVILFPQSLSSHLTDTDNYKFRLKQIQIKTNFIKVSDGEGWKNNT